MVLILVHSSRNNFRKLRFKSLERAVEAIDRLMRQAFIYCIDLYSMGVSPVYVASYQRDRKYLTWRKHDFFA